MQRPRRTTECETPSAANRQSRPSRLQQPLRRPSIRDGSLPRSTSAEPRISTGTVNRLTVPSSVKRQRSNSAINTRTPQRTPLHITPSKAAQFTGEKQRALVNDKRWIQEQVVKITEYLKTVDCGISMDFLHRGGLKTMSIKQFIALVNYFLKFIAGNKFTVASNHVESISKILNQIDYPYTVNKSWLKTPTAPHAFGNLVMLFSFFMEFIPPSNNLESFNRNYLILSEEFPDMEFAIKLSTMAEEGFGLWNNQKNEEFEKLQKAAVDELIFRKVGLAGCDAVDDMIKRLNAELDKIVSKKIVIEDEEEYFRLDKEVKTNQRKIAKLHKERHENQKNMKRLESQLNELLEQKAKMESRISEIRNVVETQEVSIEERNKLIEDVSHMQLILNTKKQSVCELQEMDQQGQVLLSRNIKKLTEKIAKFNSYIRQVMLDFKEFDVDIDNLCLYQNSEMDLDDQINKITCFLKELQKHVTNRIDQLSKRNEAFEAQIKLISYEIAEWIEPKTNEVMENIKGQQRKIDDLDREAIAVKNYINNAINEYSQRAKQASETIAYLKESIKKIREDTIKTRKENEAMMALVKDRFDVSLMIRERQVKRFQEAIDLFEKKCAEAEALMK